MTVAAEKIGCFVSASEEKPEEILGSVTHETQSNDRCFPIQLRTSARVSKKLKLDSQNVLSPTSLERKEVKLEEKLIEQKSNTVRRVHELWSTEDKNAFFEALNEYGKDFDAIQTHMNNKRKKRGINHNISKNRDQARHFYYRTWHKISKYLKFPPEVKKVVREQYGLINFGEFRKKIGFVSEKNSVKLNELIYSGSTQVRIRGKTVRIKTPVCRALKKLNELQETTTDVKLPTRILVELRPRNNESWCHVQSLAMNPRVRTTLSLQQLLVSLISYLERKWQLPDVEIKDISSPVLTEGNTAGDLPEKNDNRPILRLAPKEGISIVPPSVRSGEFVTSSNISLMAYEEKFGTGGCTIAENLKQLQIISKPGKSNRGCKKPTVDDEKGRTVSESDNNVQNSTCNDGQVSDTDFVSSTINQLLSFKSDLETSAKYNNEDPDWNSPGKDEFEPDSEITANENKEEIIKKAKAGWTAKNAESVRIGDLYLMFGAESKLQLDYWWDYECIKQEPVVEKASVSSTVANVKKKILSESLNKLISIAKLYINKEKERCLCGHVCKTGNKFINGRNHRIVTKLKSSNPSNEVEKSPNISSTDTVTSKSNNPSSTLAAMVRVNPVTCVTPRTISSFKEQIDLQYYNRRRSGDKQRTASSHSKVTIQVIKPKEDSNVDLTSEPLSDSSDNAMSSRINPEARKSDVRDIVLPSTKPLLPSTPNPKGTTELCSNLLLPDEDSKSSCSTITRFFKQALPEVIPQPVNPSPNGLSTPIIGRSSFNNISDNNGRQSPLWSMSEASSFSVSNLFTQFDVPSKLPIVAEEETRFSTDVETQFQRLINESSVDYTEKFANLAAQIASETVSPKI